MQDTNQATTIAQSEHVSDHDVIYTLRTVHQNQTQLLILADQKANVLIGIVAVILTLLFTNTTFLQSLDQRLLLPLIGFVLIEVMALFFALMVIIPRSIRKHHFKSMEKVPNPLFFGFFNNFDQQVYLDYIRENLNDDASSRELLAKDLYQIGKVLQSKYEFIKYAYGLSLAGIICLVVLCIISVFS